MFAHSVKGFEKHLWETLEDHSLRVAEAASRRASAFGCGDYAHALGLVHDLGKMKPGFQRKLDGEKNDVSHSGEGAKLLHDKKGFGALLAPAIAGHHGRLPNPEKMRERLKVAQTVEAPIWLKLRDLPTPERLGHNRSLTYFRLQFLVRMLYGTLCDADDRETAAFYRRIENRPAPDRLRCVDACMLDQFHAFMGGLSRDGPVNKLRRDILEHALQRATEAPGAFTFTVPTGGGKTLASLGFGLTHAKAHGLDRLIYVIPYTSIVEQTAGVFRSVLGQDAVLEHHANADWDADDESEAEQIRISGASWEVPVVVTTSVQFFESLFSARKKRCRKLPSLARSVIVLDEAQTLPLPLFRPCLAAVRELMDGYGATIILSTATQPSLTRDGGFPAPEVIENAREIAPDPHALFNALKRVDVADVGPLTDDELADRMRASEQVLLIVDNRLQARSLFERIRDLPGTYHLSTLMTPNHRREILRHICEDLKTDRPVRLVATSLIEAGVDVDFPYVLRAAAGIDSVAQAAGRCNREGKRKLGRVEIFRSEHPAPPTVEQFAVIGRAVLTEGHEDPIGQAAVASYFRRLWETYGVDALDAKDVGQICGILNAIQKAGCDIPYESIDEAFTIIDGGQRSVIVIDGKWGAPSDELNAFRHRSAGAGAVACFLQAHTLNVPFRLWDQLREEGHVGWWEEDCYGEQFAVLWTSDLYDEAAGLSVLATELSIV